MENLTFNNEQLEFLKFLVHDFEYNDDHEFCSIAEEKDDIFYDINNTGGKY